MSARQSTTLHATRRRSSLTGSSVARLGRLLTGATSCTLLQIWASTAVVWKCWIPSHSHGSSMARARSTLTLWGRVLTWSQTIRSSWAPRCPTPSAVCKSVLKYRTKCTRALIQCTGARRCLGWARQRSIIAHLCGPAPTTSVPGEEGVLHYVQRRLVLHAFVSTF